ncbi:MAG: transcriptional regulator [Clostridiales bacterium]|nr:transcriptional regulator [Clostridiales bacterium]
MFNVNDYIVYGTTGVCQVLEIRKEKDENNNEIQYYILQPVYNKTMKIKTPVDNDKVIMRSVITKEKVLSLIKSMPEQETVWIEDYRKRSEAYKAALRTANCQEWIKIIKTLYQKKKEKTAEGKKLMKADEEIMKAAEKSLHEEFAVVLDISPDEVPPFILKHISSAISE